MRTRARQGSPIDTAQALQPERPAAPAEATEDAAPVDVSKTQFSERDTSTPLESGDADTLLADARELAQRATSSVLGFTADQVEAEKNDVLPDIDDEVLGIRPSKNRPRADGPNYEAPEHVLTRAGGRVKADGPGGQQKKVYGNLWASVQPRNAKTTDAVEARTLLPAVLREIAKGKEQGTLLRLDLDQTKPHPLEDDAAYLQKIVIADTSYRTQIATLHADVKVIDKATKGLLKQIEREAPRPGAAESTKFKQLHEQLATLDARRATVKRAIVTAALYSPSRSTLPTERKLDDALPTDLADARRALKEAKRDLREAKVSNDPRLVAREAVLAKHVAAIESVVDSRGIPLHDLEKVADLVTAKRKEVRGVGKEIKKVLDGRPPEDLGPVQHEQWSALARASEGLQEELEHLDRRVEKLLLHHERDPADKVLDGGLAQMVERFHATRVGITIDDVPKTVDALLDLVPTELERVANHLVDYTGLKAEGIFKGQCSVADVVKILSGQLEGLGERLPSSVAEAEQMLDGVREQLVKARGPKAVALNAEFAKLRRTSTQLKHLKQFQGLDRTGIAMSLGLQFGKEGVLSVGGALGAAIRPRDRKTGEREKSLYGGALFATAVNSFGYIVKKHDVAERLRKGPIKAGLEWSVSPPYVYGGQDPIMGTNVGVLIPMVGGVVVSRDMIGVDYNFLELPGEVGSLAAFVAVSDPRIGRFTGPIIRGSEAVVTRLKQLFGFGAK